MIHIPILRRGVPCDSLDISWDQPHEGNLFEHLYARRSFQAAGAF
jgi:hypothetical protein